MNQNLVNFLFLIVGILFGIILAIGIKYPITIVDVDKAKLICKEGPTAKLKINVSGKVVEVECSNNTIFQLN